MAKPSAISTRPVRRPRALLEGLFAAKPVGRPSLMVRLLRIRVGSALILAMPALLLIVWYGWAALGSHLAYNMASGRSEPLTMELLHLHLHDRLSRDVRRLFIPAPRPDSELPTYSLFLGNEDLDLLDRNVPPKDGASYVNGYLQHDDEVIDVRVRYRGTRHWDWRTPQKSWKVRTNPGQFLDGRNVFSFHNTPDPLPFDEQIVLDVARESGLLVPDYYPCRLVLNKVYMGVYFYSAQPDEGLLRQNRRMPGWMWSGNGAPADPDTGVSSLWRSKRHWKSVAKPLDAEAGGNELKRLLKMVRKGTDVEFARFALDHLDMDKLALFDALDVVFGGNQHDFDKNHKLYFDPYRGRFEPIAWNFRGWRHERDLNRTDNPLLLRLKATPEYLTRRNRRVLELLAGLASPAAIRERGETLLRQLESDQARDPHWDAYHLLPRMGGWYRQLPRPMNHEKQAEVFAVRMATMAERAAYLRRELGEDKLTVSLAGPPPPPGSTATTLDVLLDGHAGYRLEEIGFEWPPDCAPARWTLSADRSLDGAPGADDLTLASSDQPTAFRGLELNVYPGLVLESRTPHKRRGAVRAGPQLRRYRLFVEAGGCVPKRAVMRWRNLLTDVESERTAEAVAAPAAAGPTGACTPEVAIGLAGHTSAHPWCHPIEQRETVRLGPGEVAVTDTRVYQRGQHVTIEPGTTFRLSKRASLIFLGPVRAVGTAAAPIRFLPASEKRWGGLALQGPATAGSRLAHVQVRGGSHPRWGLTQFPGMVSVHDTSDVQLSDLTLGDHQKSDDALHVAYVRGFELKRAEIRDVAGDAIDLEFSQGELTGLTVVDVGDEAIDLMGSDVTVSDARLVGSGGSAISAGEGSRLVLRDSVLASGRTALLVKNASRATLERVLLYQNDLGVRVEAKSPRYGKASRIEASSTYAPGCVTTVDFSPEKTPKSLSIAEQLEPNDLGALRARVLGLESWSQLDAALDQLRRTGAP